MAQPAATMLLKIAVSDTQASKNLVFKVYKFNKENEALWTFESLFSDAISAGKFLLSCQDQGLLTSDAIQIKGNNIEGELFTLVIDSNTPLSDCFPFFKSISQIIVLLNEKVKAVRDSSFKTEHSDALDLYSVYNVAELPEDEVIVKDEEKHAKSKKIEFWESCCLWHVDGEYDISIDTWW